MYPNPTNDVFKVQLTGNTNTEFNVKVFDVKGVGLSYSEGTRFTGN